MSSMIIKKAGLLTTLQDTGRKGYQQYGIPVAGAMDQYSLKLANILVGNSPSEAALEITLLGPTISFTDKALIALTGGEFPIKLNGKEVSSYETIYVEAGSELTIGAAIKGCRGYLAVKGGFDVPVIMGSKCTYLRGGFGGFMGRQLKEGDEISFPPTELQSCHRRIPAAMIPSYEGNYTARVIMGPEADRFTESGIYTFLNNEYTLTNQCDRMGYRVKGPIIEHTNGADIISGGVNLGAIQVPGHGNPIIMMADRQTTGGYTKIANVISVDIPRLAQLKPGDKIRFKSITIEEAQQLLRQQSSEISELINKINTKISSPDLFRRYSIRVNDKSYEVLVEEVK